MGADDAASLYLGHAAYNFIERDNLDADSLFVILRSSVHRTLSCTIPSVSKGLSLPFLGFLASDVAQGFGLAALIEQTSVE